MLRKQLEASIMFFETAVDDVQTVAVMVASTRDRQWKHLEAVIRNSKPTLPHATSALELLKTDRALSALSAPYWRELRGVIVGIAAQSTSTSDAAGRGAVNVAKQTNMYFQNYLTGSDWPDLLSSGLAMVSFVVAV